MANDLLEVREYRPGPQTLAFVASDSGCECVTSVCRKPDRTTAHHTWVKFGDEKLFTLETNFSHLGTWIFVVKQDDVTVKYLKAMVSP